MEVGHRELASIRRAHPRRQLVRDALVVAEEAHAEAEQIRGAQRIAVLLLVAGAVDARIDVRLDGVKSAAIVFVLALHEGAPWVFVLALHEGAPWVEAGVSPRHRHVHLCKTSHQSMSWPSTT